MRHATTETSRRLRRRLGQDEGTALTELAILAPIFILIFMWAQFFVDLGLVKLKAEEAARFALWEMSVHQPVGGTVQAVRDRFQDLASPAVAEFQKASPIGTHSFTAQVTVNVNLSDRLGEPFGGNIPRPPGGGSFWGQLVSWLARFTGQVVDVMIRRFALDTNTSARVNSVTMTVPNRVFPDFTPVLSLLVRDPGPPRTITVTANSPRMLVDTWKAWAGKYNPSSGDLRNIETTVYESYGSSFPGDDGMPERVVSARVRNAAYFGLGSIMNAAGRVYSFVGLGNPLTSATHAGSGNSRDRDGPVTMLPGRVERRGFAVATGRPIKRYGDEFTTNSNIERRNKDDKGEDHTRFTTPGIVHATEWDGSGGKPKPQRPAYQQRNPYTQMYDCRDIFYMGSIRSGGPGVSRHTTDFATYQRRQYRGCPTGNPQW